MEKERETTASISKRYIDSDEQRESTANYQPDSTLAYTNRANYLFLPRYRQNQGERRESLKFQVEYIWKIIKFY